MTGARREMPHVTVERVLGNGTMILRRSSLRVAPSMKDRWRASVLGKILGA